MTITAPDGAYVIGGGDWNFGQTMTEDLARAAFEFPMPTLANMIELLRLALEQLPLDALKPFQDFLGLADTAFASVAQAVQAIIDSLTQRPIFMAAQDLIEAITGIVGSGDLSLLTQWFQTNIFDELADLGTRIQNVVSSIVDFVTTGDLAAAIQGFITGSQLAAAIQDFVTNNQLVAAIQNFVTNSQLAQAIQNFITNNDLLNAIQDFITNSDLTNAIKDFVTNNA